MWFLKYLIKAKHNLGEQCKIETNESLKFKSYTNNSSHQI